VTAITKTSNASGRPVDESRQAIFVITITSPDGRF
jgi:hypothetical protein